ncbi:uncharacterized protein LOC131597764 [Vicia villosa]|uniref:uncharacterized protein LOC131597764 n=1 Tax=Vicia villosa TaxID=3911 RepID=UPI00273B1075|nr:uncharacterized protein LOC131597764 [Vicia villosa]
MKLALGAKNKFAFNDGSITPLDLDDLNRSAWERCNCLVHSWIMNFVTPPISQTTVFLENALEVWNDIQERFAKTDRICVSNLRLEINNLKQCSKFVLDYFTEIRGLWEKLNSHRPLMACTCIHQCRCQAMRSARDFRIEDQVIQFLTGLNDKFSVIKTQVLLMDPLPSINNIYFMVIQEESHTIYLLAKHDPSLALEEVNTLVNAYDSRKYPDQSKASSHNGGSQSSKGDNILCTFCNRTGYIVEVCYRKHGFPPNFGKKQVPANATTTNNGDNTVIAHNGEKGVFNNQNINISQEQYSQLISLLQQTNLTPHASSSNKTSTSNHISTSLTHSGHTSYELSGNSYSLIASCSTQNKSQFWIIDSGANDHVCSSINWFSPCHNIQPVSVFLPNGSIVIANQAGTVKISPELCINNVLNTSYFSLNLLSVSRLCASNHCVFQFFADKCVIQDLTSQKMIGLASQIEGLYKLKIDDGWLAKNFSLKSKIHNFPYIILLYLVPALTIVT